MAPGVPEEITSTVEKEAGLKINAFQVSAGGCINHTGKILTSGGEFFIKWNDAQRYPGMFEAEKAGLVLLKSAGALKIPEVIYCSQSKAFQFLLLEYIESKSKTRDYWTIFGEQLARLHLNSDFAYGLDIDNYMGSLKQLNRRHKSWPEFFISQRLKPQLEISFRSKLIGTDIYKKFDKLFEKLSSLIIDERPNLVHGDLWAGNLMTDNTGNPCLIDPAVYFGNREVDIAMTRLFGGFEMYIESYNAVYPLEKSFEERCDLYSLYPLLVHVNLFGRSYLPQVVSILNRFV
jgi:protein-ribulosamine 3-kinase